jgi:hypothetical protein
VKKHWPAVALVILYLIVGTLYAVYTPTWHVPDEPAHYNYIRSLAEGRGFPVMAPGDYDQDYLSRLTTEDFPPDLSVDDLEYEDHQPPLYYLLATPVYLLSGGAVLALRLFSLLMSGGGVGMLLLLLREFAPERPGIAWLGAGIAAFIPQFLAIMSGVNNDALVMALLWLWLWMALRYLRGAMPPYALGLVMGALLLTKSTGYGVLILAPAAIFIRYRREGQPARWLLQEAAHILLLGLLLGGLWWGRNLHVYGWPDVMGLIRHDEIVVGQPRTADWIALDGLSFFINAPRTTFRSFWGQFGWMKVVLDARIYQGLAIFTGLGLWGAAWRWREAIRAGLRPRQRDALTLLGLSAGITIAMFVGYNTTFVQHQGRYLFPALPLFGLAMAEGLNRLQERQLAVGTALIMALGIVGLVIVGLLMRDLPLWPIALIGASAVALTIAALQPASWHKITGAGVILALIALDVWCLFGFLVPTLTR